MSLNVIIHKIHKVAAGEVLAKDYHFILVVPSKFTLGLQSKICLVKMVTELLDEQQNCLY